MATIGDSPFQTELRSSAGADDGSLGCSSGWIPPEDEQRRLGASAEKLVMRRYAYWVAISGALECSNEQTVTVSIPAANRDDL